MSWALSLSCGLQSSRIKQACGVFLTSVTSWQVWGVDLWHYGGGVGIGVALGEKGDVRLEVGVALGEEVVSFLDLLSLLMRKGRPLSIWSSPWWRRDVLFGLVVTPGEEETFSLELFSLKKLRHPRLPRLELEDIDPLLSLNFWLRSLGQWMAKMFLTTKLSQD